MKRIIKTLTFATIAFFIFSCENPDKAPIVTFDSAGHGGYPRLLEETGDKLVNLFDVSGSQYGYTIEFVDDKKGDLVAEYLLEIEYVDNNLSNGDNSSGPIQFLSIPSSSFIVSPNGYKSVAVSLSALDVIKAFGLTEADILAADNFYVTGSVIMKSGAVFTGKNSSASVEGAAFRGHFDYLLSAGCPSDLAGTYDVVTSDIWCDGGTLSGSVTIESIGGGSYQFDDWSFGSYGNCYASGTATGDLNFKEVCGIVSFTGFTDSFGDIWTYNSSVNGDEWTISWENTYGESATSVITIPNLSFKLAN